MAEMPQTEDNEEVPELPCPLFMKPCTEVIATTGCRMWHKITFVKQLTAPGLLAPQTQEEMWKCKFDSILETIATVTQQNSQVVRLVQHVIGILQPSDLKQLYKGS